MDPQFLKMPFPEKENIRVNLGESWFCIEDGEVGFESQLQDIKGCSFEALFSCVMFDYHQGRDTKYHAGFRELRCTIESFSGLRSLSLVIEPDRAMGTMPTLPPSLRQCTESSATMPCLQELRLELPQCKSWPCNEILTAFLMRLPWKQLRRLLLLGSLLIETILPTFGKSLGKLRCLNLQATEIWRLRKHRMVGRPFRVPPNSPSLLPDRWYCGSEGVLARIKDFLATRRLDDLTLEGLGNALSVDEMLTSSLRKLKLHVCELDPSSANKSLLQASDLRDLTMLAPNIEHLEFDVARIGNLWQSTAVPGVDVDVRIYQVLDTVMRLQKLKRLRLFPRYYKGFDHDEGRFMQPLTDDAAVHLFRRLKEKSTSLQTLDISSDEHIASLVPNVDPMSWNLSTRGGNIILVVRQANHDYEQRQVWAGQRRLTVEIKRHSYRKPYLPEPEGWAIRC